MARIFGPEAAILLGVLGVLVIGGGITAFKSFISGNMPMAIVAGVSALLLGCVILPKVFYTLSFDSCLSHTTIQKG